MIMCTLLLMVYGLLKPCCFTHVTSTCFKETILFFNVHLGCFVGFILCPTGKYMFKVKNKKTRLICMCSSLKINTTCHRFFVFIVGFDHSQHINIVFLLLTLNKYLSVGCERPVIMFWQLYSKAYFIQQFIIAPNWNETNYDHIKCLLWYEHIMCINFSSKFARGIQANNRRFVLFIWSGISSLFPRDLIFLLCQNENLFKSWFKSCFNSLKQWNKLVGI